MKANLGNGTIRNWIVSYPAIDKFYRVAQVLEVSMEYLLYGKLTEKDKRVFQIREIKEIIEKLDDVNLQIAYDLIKGCEKRNEKEK